MRSEFVIFKYSIFFHKIFAYSSLTYAVNAIIFLFARDRVTKRHRILRTFFFPYFSYRAIQLK